jgi:4-phytase / acid phosphatase
MKGANKADMLDILQIHTQVFKKVQRDEYVSLRQGGNLLYHLSYAVEHGTDPSEPNGSKTFIAYIERDTNIANLAGILNLHWHLSEYPDDDMPPEVLSSLRFAGRQMDKVGIARRLMQAAESMLSLRHNTRRNGICGLSILRPQSIPSLHRATSQEAGFDPLRK